MPKRQQQIQTQRHLRLLMVVLSLFLGANLTVTTNLLGQNGKVPKDIKEYYKEWADVLLYNYYDKGKSYKALSKKDIYMMHENEEYMYMWLCFREQEYRLFHDEYPKGKMEWLGEQPPLTRKSLYLHPGGIYPVMLDKKANKRDYKLKVSIDGYKDVMLSFSTKRYRKPIFKYIVLEPVDPKNHKPLDSKTVVEGTIKNAEGNPVKKQCITTLTNLKTGKSRVFIGYHKFQFEFLDTEKCYKLRIETDTAYYEEKMELKLRSYTRKEIQLKPKK